MKTFMRKYWKETAFTLALSLGTAGSGAKAAVGPEARKEARAEQWDLSSGASERRQAAYDKIQDRLSEMDGTFRKHHGTPSE